MSSGEFVLQPSGIKAYYPSLLPPSPKLRFDLELQELLMNGEKSHFLLKKVWEFLPDPELFDFYIILKEAVSSSGIDGYDITAGEFLGHTAREGKENNPNCLIVENYIRGMETGRVLLSGSASPGDSIVQVHKSIVQGNGAGYYPGEFRNNIKRVGTEKDFNEGNGFYPPPASEINRLMKDLEDFIISSSGFPQLIKAALIHAQFESIHPFSRGNGRVGRILLNLYMAEKGKIDAPLFCISSYLLQNRLEYFGKLNLIRSDNNWEAWLKFFLRGVDITCTRVLDTVKKIIVLRKRNLDIITKNGFSSPAGVRVFELFQKRPVLSVRDIMKEINVSKQGAYNLVSKFLEAGIVEEITGRLRDRIFSYSGLIRIIDDI